MKSLIIIALLSVLLACVTGSCHSKRVIRLGDSCEAIAKNAGLSLDHFQRINPGLQCKHLKIGSNVCTKGHSGSDSDSSSDSDSDGVPPTTPPDTNPPTGGGGGDAAGGDA